MNYIELLNQFWSIRRSMKITAYEADLYYYLLKECNSRMWLNPFDLSTNLICAELGISRKTLSDLRNRLKQKGLIDFEEGQKNKAKAIYSLKYVTVSNIQGNQLGNIQGNIEGNILGNHIKNKQKQKRKLKQDNIPPSPPKGDLELVKKDAEIEALKKALVDAERRSFASTEQQPKKVIGEVKEEFERFRKAYPGNKGGLDIEFERFRKKHKDFAEAIFLLYPALQRLIEWRDKKRSLNQFVPEFAHLQTWISQRRWEVEFEKIERNENTGNSTAVERYRPNNGGNTSRPNAADARASLENLRGLCNAVLQQPASKDD